MLNNFFSWIELRVGGSILVLPSMVETRRQKLMVTTGNLTMEIVTLKMFDLYLNIFSELIDS